MVSFAKGNASHNAACHNAAMPVTITIRNVPEEMRDRLTSLAAEQGLSMQKFLLGELKRIAYRPTNTEWVRDVERRKQAQSIRIPTSVILEAKDADKR